MRMHAAGLAADGSHWRVYQEVLRPDGKDAATLSIQGGWIHLDERKLVAPPGRAGGGAAVAPSHSQFRGAALAAQARIVGGSQEPIWGP